jgi:hypothetical protein
LNNAVACALIYPAIAADWKTVPSARTGSVRPTAAAIPEIMGKR